MIETLNLFEIIIFDVKDKYLLKKISDTFSVKEIKDLCFIILEIETKSERLPERFIHAYLKFIQCILSKEILDHEKQVFILCFIIY